MEWRKIYDSKLVTPEEAVNQIKSGDRVVVGHAVGEPQTLIDAMVENKDCYEDVEIVHMVAMGKSKYVEKGMEKHFRHNSLFVGSTTREAVKEGRADYIPVFFSEIPSLFRELLPVDVALIQVSSPDEHGYCSFGVSVDYTKEACKRAKLVIVQVNKHMPRTLGDCFIHVSEMDFIVEKDEPIIELIPPKIGKIEKEIGRHCASLINDGDTLQLGIGGIPDAVLSCLYDKKDLGIHSEMFSDGVVDLVNAGVINNSKKTYFKNKMVATFLMGTKKLYDFVNNNPMVEMRSADFVNNPVEIMKNDNIVCINSCVQVDLMGQVVSDSIGSMQISGVGGQVDFVRGASMSKNGKSIIAMSSTVKGKVSKIVPVIDKGAAVTTSRNDVDYIVTEYGIARLKGKNLRQRAEALIEIAHPDFRQELREAYLNKYNIKNS
ncbi:acetyl-CoA hydrolase/transferase family protein [Anaerosalibacter massiliensis]|uniref:acetyl-CoA hydrolase/transferase family protein n=1 Tax=Anaerosalibacter massiliensis TaxID=1347392 RepID=UPI0005B2BA99|nr:acetyl-CoA hydrolase/transferase C-terminal domain-containing protein [Anaerosalibacter massiliensis]